MAELSITNTIGSNRNPQPIVADPKISKRSIECNFVYKKKINCSVKILNLIGLIARNVEAAVNQNSF